MWNSPTQSQMVVRQHSAQAGAMTATLVARGVVVGTVVAVGVVTIAGRKKEEVVVAVKRRKSKRRANALVVFLNG